MAAGDTKVNMVGIKTIKMGEVGTDGEMGASLIQYSKIKEGSITMEFNPPEETEIGLEDSDYAFVTILGKRVNTLSFTLMDLKMTDLVTLKGGTFTAGAGGKRDTYAEPIVSSIKIMCAEIMSQNADGTDIGFELPKCQVIANMDGAPTKTDAVGVKVTLKVQQPTKTDGTAVSAIRWVGGPVVS